MRATRNTTTSSSSSSSIGFTSAAACSSGASAKFKWVLLCSHVWQFAGRLRKREEGGGVAEAGMFKGIWLKQHKKKKQRKRANKNERMLEEECVRCSAVFFLSYASTSAYTQPTTSKSELLNVCAL